MSHPCQQSGKCCPCNIHEPPERDTPQSPKGSLSYRGEFPPPDPPPGNDGEWELQFCKWWGWTWVRKGDKGRGCDETCQTRLRGSLSPKRVSLEVEEEEEKEDVRSEVVEEEPPPSSKQKGGFFSCFGRKKDPPRREQRQPTPVPSTPQPEPQVRRRRYVEEPSSSSSEECCCCCCCHQCCCCGDYEKPPRRYSRNTETQTRKSVREMSTHVSRSQILNKHHRHKSRKRRGCRRCCCCKPVCCPCVQNVKESPRPSLGYGTTNDKIVGCCLTPNEKLNPNFLTLHKPLDLLLKNNTNIMKMFMDVKFGKEPQFKETISHLSVSETLRKTDADHCKLLTAVCDAILSSHKFDDVLKGSVSRSTQMSGASTQTNFLEKLLKDLRPGRPSNEAVSIQTEGTKSEVGVQVAGVAKAENFCQTRVKVFGNKLNQTSRALGGRASKRANPPAAAGGKKMRTVEAQATTVRKSKIPRPSILDAAQRRIDNMERILRTVDYTDYYKKSEEELKDLFQRDEGTSFNPDLGLDDK